MSNQRFLDLSLSSPQTALAASLATNDLAEFKRALRNGASVNVRDQDAEYSIFEIACSTPGKKDFITACLKQSALVAEINPTTNEYPIHLAALSEDSENLSALLESHRIVIDQKFEDRTALFLLFENLSGDNYEKVFECIKLLLKHGANINATDENSVSPIAKLVKGKDRWRKDILEYCFKHYGVNVDFRNQQARKLIEKNFPDVTIPYYDMETITVEILRSKLSAGLEEDFLEAFRKFGAQKGTLADNDFKDLLSLAVYRAKLESAKTLLEPKMTNETLLDAPLLLSGLLAKCCNRGNVEMLQWLLSIIPKNEIGLINEDTLLSLLVKQIDAAKDKNKCPYFKIMKLLLEDGRIDIDKLDSTTKRTALHFAVKYKIDHAQELLLAKGASLSVEDMFSELPITDMDPFLLEKHLDSCVSSNDRKPGDDDYEVKIDFSNFVPPTHKANNSDTARTPAALLYEDEMLPILRMAQYSDMKRLLRHPVISSILLLKWIKLSVFFYINLLICTVFFVSFIFYVVFCYGRDEAPFKLFFYSLSLIGLVYLILRELIQFLLNMRVYVRSPENYMEIALILAACSVLLYEFGDDARRVASALVILLTALEFTLLVGTLPLLSISTHMVMLKTVSKNFLKCLVLYSIILLAFAFSFYTLFRVNDSNPADSATTSEAPGGDDDQFNQFSDIPLALMKTAVMLTGEFEAANIKFQGVTYVVFALFLFFVSIVLFNLMNGLAVSDTTIIKAESELIGLIQKVFVIYKYENALKTSKPIRCITDNMSWLYPANSLQLFPNTVPLRHITIKPNRSNTILIPSLVERGSLDPEKGTLEMKRSAESDRMLPQTDTFSTHCCVFRFNRGMDGKIVKYALEILHSRQENVGSIEYRITRIEQSLESIKAMILALSSK
ncbi:transient receptor potential cation channel protein painless-like [Anopheles darlingi]|uniref:transient receptor potential cation channel protein painless-like n=1 Tax=Anopheles darlingi TaxID=43151 RepID=UPI0021001EB4|nr:transient receptor potential cation channel protein painless-like [Anopheles darlingi]